MVSILIIINCFVNNFWLFFQIPFSAYPDLYHFACSLHIRAYSPPALFSSSWVPHSTTLPSFMTTILSACRQIPTLWEMTTEVLSWIRFKNPVRQTSLRKAYKQWLLSGGIPGTGNGLFLLPWIPFWLRPSSGSVPAESYLARPVILSVLRSLSTRFMWPVFALYYYRISHFLCF